MAASRATSLRALRNVSAASTQIRARNLHMTGPATFSNLLTTERPAMSLPSDYAGLRAECQKRRLPASGTKAELVDRLTAHELAHSRTFSTSAQDSKRPTLETSSTSSTAPVRHFNTSRALKAVKDSSTIDFAYLPDFDPDTNDAPVRVPLLPQTSVKSSYKGATEIEDVVMRPEIITASADSTHISAPSAMSEVVDNNAVDFQGMAAKVSEAAAKFGRGQVEEKAGMAREVFDGLMDDLFGPKSGAKPT